ncbi:MAG: hypothetical protein JO170_07800 [Verrucomicrobia bacterium]|nr:hypothetical protein [Verrucomicrobiota bacterium]
MQTNTLGPSPVEERLSERRNLTAETAVDSTVVAHLFRAALAWAVAYFAAMMTTMVLEFDGFWRDLWLGICVATFIFSFVSVILAIGAFSIPNKGRQQADSTQV